jgi:DMSO/TMAO reductase YedYZ molybdopterin-dependent catalytic subunit
VSPRVRRLIGLLIGLLAAGVAVGVGEIFAAFVRPAASPIIVVGNRFVLLTPEPMRLWAIRQFGTNDKTVLLTGIYVVIGIFALGVGLLTVQRLWYGLAGFAGFGAIGIYCALTTNAHRASDVVPMVAATIAGAAALAILSIAAFGEHAARPTAAKVAKGQPSRRLFMQVGSAAAGIAVFGGLGGRSLQHSRFSAAKARAAVTLPEPSGPSASAPALVSDTDLGKSGIPFITPNEEFYRIDTALTVPQIDPKKWSLRIHGMVDHEMRLTYDDILARPMIERWITLACVSNEVGGDLIGNALFRGTRFADVLREVGVHSGADQLVLRSSDGMTIGTPTAVVMDGRDALLAVGMNGTTLPVVHGFPVRVVVPGLYGYVSACKWIVDIEATTFSAFNAYWVDEGWVQQAPVMLASRIDTPSSGQSFKVGETVTIAGVAWDQHVGVSKIEVQVDSGEWLLARLASVPSIDTWRQWVVTWVATSGSHLVRVRATDASGNVQSAKTAEPYPAASSGYHTVHISAR